MSYFKKFVERRSILPLFGREIKALRQSCLKNQAHAKRLKSNKLSTSDPRSKPICLVLIKRKCCRIKDLARLCSLIINKLENHFLFSNGIYDWFLNQF